MPRRATIKTEGLVSRERQQEILRLIRESGPDGISRLALTQKLAISLRSVDRAIGLLEGAGARLERIRAGRPTVQHFVLQKGPGWDEHVTPAARIALRLAGISLSQSGTLLWQDKLETLEELVSDRMSQKDRRLFDRLISVMRVQGAGPDRGPRSPGTPAEGLRGGQGDPGRLPGGGRPGQGPHRGSLCPDP